MLCEEFYMTRKKRPAGAPAATREGACAPQAMNFVVLGEDLESCSGIVFYGEAA
jgi:hypothetical protein